MRVEIHGTPEELNEKGPAALAEVAKALIAQGVDPWMLVKAVIPLSISHEMPDSPVSHGLLDRNRGLPVPPHHLPMKTDEKAEMESAATAALKGAPPHFKPDFGNFVRQEPVLDFKSSVEEIESSEYLSDLKQYVLQYAKDREIK